MGRVDRFLSGKSAPRIPWWALLLVWCPVLVFAVFVVGFPASPHVLCADAAGAVQLVPLGADAAGPRCDPGKLSEADVQRLKGSGYSSFRWSARKGAALLELSEDSGWRVEFSYRYDAGAIRDARGRRRYLSLPWFAPALLIGLIAVTLTMRAFLMAIRAADGDAPPDGADPAIHVNAPPGRVVASVTGTLSPEERAAVIDLAVAGGVKQTGIPYLRPVLAVTALAFAFALVPELGLNEVLLVQWIAYYDPFFTLVFVFGLILLGVLLLARFAAGALVRAILRRRAEALTIPQTFAVEEQGFRVTTSEGSSLSAWSAIAGVRLEGDFAIVEGPGGTAIPRRLFASPEQLEAFVFELRARCEG